MTWKRSGPELDNIFTGCQDPWNYKDTVPLPACTNITEILGSYNHGPAAFGWDGQFWDRQYMGERELASIERNGMKCSVPCQETEYRLEAGYLMINKYYIQFLFFGDCSPAFS